MKPCMSMHTHAQGVQKKNKSFSLWSPFLPVWKMSRAFEGKHRTVERNLCANIKDTPCQPLPPPSPFLSTLLLADPWPYLWRAWDKWLEWNAQWMSSIRSIQAGRERERDRASKCTTSKCIYPLRLKWSQSPLKVLVDGFKAMILMGPWQENFLTKKNKAIHMYVV